jgi:TonB family protein
MDAFRTDDLSTPLGPFILASLVVHLVLVFLLPIASIEVPERPVVGVSETPIEPGGEDIETRGLLAPLGSLRMQVLELAPSAPAPSAPAPARPIVARPTPGPAALEVETAPSRAEVTPAPAVSAAPGPGTGEASGEQAAPGEGGAGAGGDGSSGPGAGTGLGAGVVTPPVIVAMVWPEFPRVAKKQLKVPIVLAVHVTAEGTVDQVEVEVASGCPPCEEAAMASAWQLRFEPATKDGVPMAMWTRFPVVFGRR